MKKYPKSFLLICREAAMACPNARIRKLLKAKADDLQQALFMLNSCPSVEHMRQTNACWTRAHMILEKAYPNPDPSPRSLSA